ncbi:heparinase [Adhaeribacter aerolatus]|uniref:Heparinase n=1 Tax=Adhaeribacter aerolatus TaxID=670289 RepID=A0A512AXM2_9BACT|nr:alginate lyase family protein [Adhaeribacter aerolatus]GEO04453.1 heparinase [Adhaeribacter aerolatus]
MNLVTGQTLNNPEAALQAAQKLLSRLDLNATGLEKVKAQEKSPLLAAEALLAYYRSRSSVKHPINPRDKAGQLGKCASEKDLKIANDALQHIFVGQPAYPAHFCGEDINWATNPYPDKEWIWQLNRMTFWDAMGLAYWHTGEEKYAQEWCAQLVDWTRKNPRDEAHQYAWRSIEAGIRGYHWTGLFQRFLYAPSFTPAVLVAFLNSCYDHSEYLTTKYTKGSNWGLMEAEGLAFIAITFPEFKEAENWTAEGIKRLNQEIQNQVYADGHQRELAFGYHMGCIDWFLRTYNLAGLNGRQQQFSPAYTQVIQKMCEVPMKLSFGDGTTPQFGDSWSGKPGQYYPKLKTWAQLFNRPDFLYVATEGKAGTMPAQTAFALEKSGLYSMRSGWSPDDICLVLKCGPNGGGHSQPDNGTFELYAGGRHLMPDAGSYIYSGDPVNRAWFRQTKVHQTLTLNGANSAYAPKQLLWQPGKDLDVLVVENASYPNLTHRRAVFFVDKQYFIIVDEAVGEGAGEIDLHFQLAPGKAIFDNEKLAVRTDFTEGWNVLVQTNSQPGINLEEEEGQVSFVYTKKEPRPAFRYRVRKVAGQKGIRFVTVVAPYTGLLPKVKAKVMGNPEIGTSQLRLTVGANGRSKKISFNLKE